MAHDPLKDGKVSFDSKKIRKILYYFMLDTHNKLMANMSEMSISPHNPNATWPDQGVMERSIHETIVNNSGGNSALVRFFYVNYAKFVEIGVQKDMPYVALPPMQGIEPVERPDGKPRKAKPFLHSEIRRRVERTITRIGKVYIYAGAASMFYAVYDPANPNMNEKNERSLMALANELGIQNL